jgi:hypothetical protein
VDTLRCILNISDQIPECYVFESYGMVFALIIRGSDVWGRRHWELEGDRFTNTTETRSSSDKVAGVELIIRYPSLQATPAYIAKQAVDSMYFYLLSTIPLLSTTKTSQKYFWASFQTSLSPVRTIKLTRSKMLKFS